jgi:energy-coupling factor transporter transmembrane protein EcfT
MRLMGNIITANTDLPKIGITGYLAVFAWSVLAVMLTPARYIHWIAVICFVVAAIFYPQAFRSMMRLRWLIMIVILALPPVFVVGELDRNLGGIPYSSTGLVSSIQIAIRILVVLMAINGLTSSVDITSVAGLLERTGLHGIGFSVGVALNLLPSLQQSALNAWRSLWMRGGLRKERLRALRLMAVTIMASALNRAEEIALAAEARAFSPERARALPVKNGKYDKTILVLCLLGLLPLILLPR